MYLRAFRLTMDIRFKSGHRHMKELLCDQELFLLLQDRIF